MSQSAKNILFIMTGSIACYKACSVLSKLNQLGYRIQVVMTAHSLRFISKSTIEGLTGRAPLIDMYADGQAMDHINLLRWADLILVAPATANYINKITNGLGDDLVSTLFLAHDFKKPFLIAPAMNTKMYLHPTTQNSIAKLKSFGVKILETASGVLACGETGYGRLLEPDLILEEVLTNLNVPIDSFKEQVISLKRNNLSVLVTGGGTSDPIDDVRVITNKSTGKTAAAIADFLYQMGINVTYLKSENALKNQSECKQIYFSSFNDLKEKLVSVLNSENFDFVIHAAAVSDYSISDSKTGKIDSSSDEIILTLKKNPKLIDLIKKIQPSTQLVGFKLTSTTDKNKRIEKVEKLFKNANCDLVVQNDWNDIKSNLRIFNIFNSHKTFETANSTEELAAYLFEKMKTHFHKKEIQK